MSWRRIDDAFDVHPKVETLRALGPRRFASAIAVWTLAGCHASRADGTFTDLIVRRLRVASWPRAVLDLTSAGLIRDLGNGCYRFHDWEHYNEGEDEKAAKRLKNADRQRRFREKRNAARNALRNALVTDPRTRPVPVPVTPSENRDTSKIPSGDSDPPAQSDLELVAHEPAPDHVAETWALFRELHAPGGRPGPDPVLTSARKSRIRARLREGTQADLAAALRGALADPWIMGTADGSPGYRRLETIFRDRGQVERLGALDGQPEAVAETSGPAPVREAHEFEDDDPDEVWGPRPEGMKSIIPKSATRGPR